MIFSHNRKLTIYWYFHSQNVVDYDCPEHTVNRYTTRDKPPKFEGMRGKYMFIFITDNTSQYGIIVGFSANNLIIIMTMTIVMMMIIKMMMMTTMMRMMMMMMMKMMTVIMTTTTMMMMMMMTKMMTVMMTMIMSMMMTTMMTTMTMTMMMMRRRRRRRRWRKIMMMMKWLYTDSAPAIGNACLPMTRSNSFVYYELGVRSYAKITPACILKANKWK